LAKSKSYQFYSNVLKQFDILSSKLNTSVSDKSHVNILASMIAYKCIGAQLMKKLSMNSWKKFDELLSSVDFYKLAFEDKKNLALTRWSLYFQEESDKLSEFSAQILHDKIVLLASAEWHAGLSKGQADKVQKLQQDYLVKLDDIMKESLNFEIEQKRRKIMEKYYKKKNSGVFFSERKKNFVASIKKLTASSKNRFSSIRVFINAPIADIFAKLRLIGYVHPIKNKAVSNLHLGFYTD
jgi:hypothetical protein